MKYFRIFNNASDYIEYMATEDAVVPNVSYCSGDSNTYITPSKPSPTCTLAIEGLSSITAETCLYNAMYGTTDVTTSSVWSITSGSEYATINSSNGNITISTTASESSVTIQAVYNGQTATKDITLTYQSGSSAETATEVVVDVGGNTTTVVTTTTTNNDGTSTEVSEVVIANSNGNVIETIESTKETNADGSYESSTVNYNSEGNPTKGSNVTGDSEGNVSTQGVKYDNSGNTVVTGYTIDTSGSYDGSKSFSGDGANTDYYAFDLTHGFVLDFNFSIDFSNQPPGQDQNHHNILTAKRATPEPWYGFQLRQSSTNKYMQLGTQFETGGNTNTTINPSMINGNVAEYNLKITYDPFSTGNTFICKDGITGNDYYTSNKLFPDIEELRYLKVVIGYSLDSSGNPFRYSNIEVYNFSLKQISNIANPVINCDGHYTTITCGTSGANIYYRVNRAGDYVLYTEPFQITADTIVEAYCELNGETTDTVMSTCIFDSGIETPLIYCDGQYVTLTCDEPSVDIYYRFNESGNYSVYTDALEITANTVVEAYSNLNGATSRVVKQNCTFIEAVAEPTISCNGQYVTITCGTAGTTIYYRLNQTGSYNTYSSPIEITADTTVESYAKLGSRTSDVAMENCIYNPVHDYSFDYLTFRVLTGGNIVWKALGSNATKTIEYSIDNGSWNSITSTSNGVSISVSQGETVRFRGSNTRYCEANKNNYSAFYEGSAIYDVEGNIMSLIYGDNFTGQTTLTTAWALSNVFNHSNVISAENLIMPAMTLTQNCYRAMFANSPNLTIAPALPATTIAASAYTYMFDNCLSLTIAPELPATTLVSSCYNGMFHSDNGNNISYIRCLATPSTANTQNWVDGVASSGTFVKASGTNWSTGVNGIPNGWTVIDDGQIVVSSPTVSCDGEEITMSCSTADADIYYRLNQTGSYSAYTAAIVITANTIVEAYASLGGESSSTITQTCEFVSNVPFEASNRVLNTWTYNNAVVTAPYSVNAIDGHSSKYAKGTFYFETSVTLHEKQPTYLWFQHADQSASIYLDNSLIEKHWGGYTSFFVDISDSVHSGTNNLKIGLKNNEGDYLAPAAGDFNFNATLGYVKLFTSPYIPSMDYGYDGFHVTSQFDFTSTAKTAASAATISVKTAVPTGATVICTISSGSTIIYSASSASTGEEMVFTSPSLTGNNLHLWNGTKDPFLYDIKLEIYHGQDLYHRYERGYGLRFYEYAINKTITVSGDTIDYTGFLLNGVPYLLRGVCMHSDIDGKANALTYTDIENDFTLIQDLGCNFLRLAHYPHPKEVYDKCDELGIVVQTEAPCVNKMQASMPSDYYTHLNTQYREMVNQHYNHPSILFWGLSNETTTDDKAFAKQKIEDYTSLIKSLDSERLVGYVMSHSYNDPSGYYNNPNGVDWFGCNIYVGWYIDKASNDPTSQLTSRITNTITNKGKALAFSEYGCGGTQRCHSLDPQTTTTKGNYERHDIEYMMWLHEGHIASIKNFPELMFTAQWQLFDIAVSNRNEGYTICLDGENTSIDDKLRRLNNKGLVERDHITRKDTFYLYKAWWNPTPFVHICQKDFTKTDQRVIKCYTNQTTALTLKVNGTTIETKTPTDNILTFTAHTFSSGDVVTVEGNGSISDTFTFA